MRHRRGGGKEEADGADRCGLGGSRGEKEEEKKKLAGASCVCGIYCPVDHGATPTQPSQPSQRASPMTVVALTATEQLGGWIIGERERECACVCVCVWKIQDLWACGVGDGMFAGAS